MNNDVIGKIFFESAPVEKNVVNIQTLPNNVVRMECILQDADTPNRNGRVYPKKVLENALNSSFVKEKLSTNSWLGEMNHPPAGSTLQRQMMVDMSNVSHLIKKYWWDGKLLMGMIETASTSVGKDFAGLIRDNQMICSFSMRGGGDVTKKNGYDHVKDPLQLITYDAVHFPSHKSAYMKRKINENTEIDVTVSMLTDYIAEQSDNHRTIMESLECFGSTVDLKLEENKLLIVEKDTKTILGYSVLEKKLKDEYHSTLNEMFFN